MFRAAPILLSAFLVLTAGPCLGATGAQDDPGEIAAVAPPEATPEATPGEPARAAPVESAPDEDPARTPARSPVDAPETPAAEAPPAATPAPAAAPDQTTEEATEEATVPRPLDQPPDPRPAHVPAEGPGPRRCTPDGAHCIRLASYLDDVCVAIQTAATQTGIDTGFLARLLWKESLFDAAAISPAGAQGIAQFMPGTAALRGLADPFNPAEAIFASATYLAELTARFGSPGMAAVAYNGGEDRAERYLARGGALPGETLDYVDSITGHSARTWRETPPDAVDYRLDGDTPFLEACLAQAKSRAVRSFADPIPPWGVVIATARRRGAAEAMAARMQTRFASALGDRNFRVVRATVPGMGDLRWYTVQLPAGSRTEAMNTCLRLRSSGAICRINRN